MQNSLEGSRYVYVAPNGESKMITFTHNRVNDEEATHNGGWDTSYISRGFYESSVKPRDNYSFNRDSKTANFPPVEDHKGGPCSPKLIGIIVALLLLAAGAAAAAYFVLGVGRSQQ